MELIHTIKIGEGDFSLALLMTIFCYALNKRMLNIIIIVS
jgi:hypothetical protein